MNGAQASRRHPRAASEPRPPCASGGSPPLACAGARTSRRRARAALRRRGAELEKKRWRPRRMPRRLWLGLLAAAAVRGGRHYTRPVAGDNHDFDADERALRERLGTKGPRPRGRAYYEKADAAAMADLGWLMQHMWKDADSAEAWSGPPSGRLRRSRFCYVASRERSFHTHRGDRPQKLSRRRRRGRRPPRTIRETVLGEDGTNQTLAGTAARWSSTTRCRIASITSRVSSIRSARTTTARRPATARV